MSSDTSLLVINKFYWNRHSIDVPPSSYADSFKVSTALLNEFAGFER